MPHQKNSMICNLWAPFLRLLKLLRTHKYFTINVSIIIALGMALQGWLYHYERYGTQNQVFWVHLGSMYLLSGYSFLVGWGINHWWDCYVSRDSFRYPDLTLIKVVPYERIILQVLVLQSFWLMYWLRNPFILIILIAIITLYSFNYSIAYARRDIAIKSPSSWPLIVRKLHDYNYKEVDLLREPRLVLIINEVNATSSLYHKLRLIFIDFKMALGKGYESAIGLFFFFFFLIQFLGIFTLPFTTPLNNYQALWFNYAGDFPSLSDAQFYPQTAYQVRRSSAGKSGSSLKFELFNQDQKSILQFSVSEYVPLFVRPSGLSGYEAWKTYEQHQGVADFWLSPRFNKLLQMHDAEPYRLDHQTYTDYWRHRRNKTLWGFWGAIILYLLWQLKDYWIYRSFEGFYQAYQQNPKSIDMLPQPMNT